MSHLTLRSIPVLLAVLLAAPLLAQRGRPLRLRGPAYRAGEVLVGYRAGQMTKALGGARTQYGATLVRSAPTLRLSVVRSSQATRDLAGFCRALRKLPGVRYAEPNYYRRVLLAAPNDPAYNNLDDTYAPLDPDLDPSDYTWYQWGMHQVEALAAWSIYPGTYYTSATKPAGAPKVAVIDTGIDYGGTDATAHPDFINAGGSSANAASGGQVDMADRRNVISGTLDVTDAADDYGHGTAVAGVIGAAANNGGGSGGEGIAGLAYHCQLMPVKTFDNTGNGTAADTATAIAWAVDHGALVINISAGDVYYSQAEQEAVDYAWEHGSLVVVAAGNEGDGANRTFYPASCTGALGVAATVWPDDSTASYSNFGDYVGISAPGGDASLIPLSAWLTWTTIPTEDVPIKATGIPASGNYQYQAGTSLACPFVAGLASLYAAHFGITQATPNGVRRIYQALQRGCDDVAGVAGWSPYWGWGRINAGQTLLDANNRGSAVGCLTGQLLYVDTVVGNATVRAKVAGTSTVVASATTHSDGTFRLANVTPGTYDVTGTYLGKSATAQNLVVVASADTPHVKLVISEGGNQAPSAPTSVAVTPARPTTASTLTAAASGGTDPDGQTVTYEYKWEKCTDGSTWLAGPTGSPLSADNTARGEKWRAQARSSDGTAFSSWVTSNTVTIVNAAPTLDAMEIRPLSPRSDQELQASPSGAADADGDTLSYRFSWEKSADGGSTWLAGPTGKVVGAEAIARGERWRVSGRVYDGTVYSAWVVSDPVTIRNCPPEPPTWATISPANPSTTSTLTASAGGASDSDGDAVTYRYGWYSSPNGTSAWTAGPAGRTLAASYTSAGEYWRVGVRTYDGAATSRLFFSSAVLIGNAPPGKPTLVTVAPAKPLDGSNLRAAASGSADPDGTTPSYRFRWYCCSDGTTWLPGPTGSLLEAADTSVGEQWRVAARAYDGQAYSGWTLSAPVTIGAAAVALRSLSATASAAMTKGGGVQVTVSLSAPAKVGVTVRNLAGRPVAVLAERSLAAGLNTLLWNGRGSNGCVAPPGSYLLTVEAHDADGSQTTTVVPLQR